MKLGYNVFFLASAFSLVACGAGTNNNPTISAAVISGSSSCVNMTNGNQCTIQLTYNAKGISGLALSNTSLLLQFSLTGLTNCQTPAGNSNQQCSVTLKYNSSGTPVPNQNIAFTLGAVTSNQITYSGQ